MKRAKKLVKILATLLLLTITTSILFFYFEPIQKFLVSNDLTFQIGNYQFSLYLLIRAAIIIMVLLWAATFFSKFGQKKIKSIKKIKSSNRLLITKIFQVSVYFFAFLIALEMLGINLTTFAVIGGAIGIGIGFGLQKITSNFISGIILLLEKSIEQGDLIELDDGTSGYVRYTGARYTLVETFENREIMIPNEDFITSRVTNWTFSNTLGRIQLDVGVAYSTDLTKAHDLILEAAKEHPRCSNQPEPECYLMEFGDSSVNFRLFFWVDDIIEGRKRPRSDVLFSIWDKFHKNNITIPFPQRDVHIKEQGAKK